MSVYSQCGALYVSTLLSAIGVENFTELDVNVMCHSKASS